MKEAAFKSFSLKNITSIKQIYIYKKDNALFGCFSKLLHKKVCRFLVQTDSAFNISIAISET
jgi:hypothetical protein